jgi:hypothetical protein
MRRSAYAIAFLALGALQLCAQNPQASEGWPVGLGLKVGVPVTETFSTSPPFSYHVPRYEFGVSAQFRVPFHHLRFEVDGLYKRGGFNSGLPISPGLIAIGPGSGLTSFNLGGVAYRPTTFNQWEIPGLFKYQFALGHYRPFVDFGASYRHISTITQTTYAPGITYGVISDNSIALHNRNSFGGVAGIGITFKKGPFELTPEARYTRWANEPFQITGLRTNLDQGDVLLGISF